MGLLKAAVVAVCLSAVVFGQEESDEQQILRQMNYFHRHTDHPNPEQLYDQLYAPGAYLLPPGEKATTGKENILALFRSGLKTVKDAKALSRKLDIMGNIAIMDARYEEDGANGEVLETGKALTVWKKVDGKWKILYTMWNNS